MAGSDDHVGSTATAADEEETLELPEATNKMVAKLRCQACTILIGTGYYEQTVWMRRGKWVCHSCAKRSPGTVQIATAEEVNALTIGELHRLLVSRSEEAA